MRKPVTIDKLQCAVLCRIGNSEDPRFEDGHKAAGKMLRLGPHLRHSNGRDEQQQDGRASAQEGTEECHLASHNLQR